jgi:hypothetical protein
MAEKKFFVDINLQGSALTNAKIGTNTGIGSTEGAFGYDSSAHRLQYFDGTATKEVANLSDIAAVTGGLIFQGGYDPTTDTPDITDGTAYKGFFWAATAAGTFLGESVQVGDSIVAKIDSAGATIADWLILQGNVVIATDSVDGISRLATQNEANGGTEGGAVVITPATLQGKIDEQITPVINDKFSRFGGAMSGSINMAGNSVTGAVSVDANQLVIDDIYNFNNADINLKANLDAESSVTIVNLPAPTNGGDAANKTYVDGAAAQALADANAYTDTGLAAKLDLAGGTMSGSIEMQSQSITNLDILSAGRLYAANGVTDISVNTNLNFLQTSKITDLPAPTSGGDAANKDYVDTAASTAQANAEATASADATTKADAAEAAAEAYADSLAPNYDSAGAAATAESNANAYTDTAISQEVTDRNNAIAALSYATEIATGDWTLNGDTYEFTLTHNLGSTLPVITFFDGSYSQCDFISVPYGPTAMLVKSNILPAGSVFASLVKGAM